MTKSQRYDLLKQLARNKREEYGVTTSSIGLAAVRDVYKAEGIKLDLWRQKLRKVRAAYLVIDGEPHVLVKASLPAAPRLFAECHELKHHLVDRQLAEQGGLVCQDESWHDAPEREIGAEIFAAEFIYPEAEFLDDIQRSGIDGANCDVERVISFKRMAVPPISYTFIVKRLEFCGVAKRGTFFGVQWQKREEQIYGPPVYKRIRAYRGRRSLIVR